MAEYAKPVPVPSEDSAPYWAAAKKHELKLQKCDSCGAFRFPPAPVCSECTALGGTWTKLSGKGKVHSFVVFHRSFHKAFDPDLPYAVALIALDEGPRIISNVVGVAPDKLRCDMPVEVIFEDVTAEATLPKFRPMS